MKLSNKPFNSKNTEGDHSFDNESLITLLMNLTMCDLRVWPQSLYDTNFVLFADDTNIFVKAVNKMLAYEKANKVLEQLNLYMLVNKLHINMSKCCFIDFKSPESDNEN